MTLGSTKKKRKGAKKKNKKNKSKSNNKGISINSRTSSQGEVDLKTQEFGNGYNQSELNSENCSCSSVGLVSESKTMEGSGNRGVEKPETEQVMKGKKEEVEVVNDFGSEGNSMSRTVSIECVEGTTNELGDGGSLVEKVEALEKEVCAKLKEGDGGPFVEAVSHVDSMEDAVSDKVICNPLEKIVLASDQLAQVVEDVPVVKTEIPDVNALPETETKDKMSYSQVLQATVNEKTNDSVVTELDSKENEDSMVTSLDAPKVETEESKEFGSTERSQNKGNLPLAPSLAKQTTWKSCCGLFDVLTGSNR